RIRRRRSPTLRARLRVASTSDHLGLAAGRLDLFDRGAAEGMGADREPPAQLAAAQPLDAVPTALAAALVPHAPERDLGTVLAAAEGMGADREPPAQLAAAQHLDAVPTALDEALIPQQLDRDLGIVVEAVQGLDVHRGQGPPEGRVREAALRQAPLQGRLTA